MIPISLDTNKITEIIKKTISEMDASKEQIFHIVDSLRSEQETTLLELAQLRHDIHKVIDEVDSLEKQDKAMRMRLAEVSADFKLYNEVDIKIAYEKATDSRIQLVTKRNEENALKQRRSNLELALRKLMDNIVAGEKIINQICIALGYLGGDILSALKTDNEASEMLLGIKILETQENERIRIARDIHDGPAQHMANVVMRVDICKNLLKKDLEEGLQELEALKLHVKSALKEVRGILFALRPFSIEETGLSCAIRELVDTIVAEGSMDINLNIMPIQIEIQPIIQVAVYRLVQEIFNNIQKHSKATHAQLKLSSGTEYLSLTIGDNGIGFDVSKTIKAVKTKGTSYGLLGILDRVSTLQGKIEIKSTENTGTVYYIQLPISEEVIKNGKKGN